MKIEEIGDPLLRIWITDYTMQIASDRKAAKVSCDDMRLLWRGYREDDWRALRTLLELRPRAEERFDRSLIQRAILDRIDACGSIRRNGIDYRHPYSVGLEVAALRELMGEVGEAVVETVEFHS